MMCSRSGRVGVLVVAVVLAGSLPGVATADKLSGQPIYVQNDAARTIWVAARYKPPGSGDFVNAGFWQIEPGQRLLVVYNGNARYLFLHAHDTQGGVYRGQGTSLTETIRGRTVTLFPFDTGVDYEPRTIRFYELQR
jgi:uncharacterized membrane protein